jgi:hypothetical protein
MTLPKNVYYVQYVRSEKQREKLQSRPFYFFIYTIPLVAKNIETFNLYAGNNSTYRIRSSDEFIKMGQKIHADIKTSAIIRKQRCLDSTVLIHDKQLEIQITPSKWWYAVTKILKVVQLVRILGPKPLERESD